MVLENHRSRVSADDPQSRLFSDTRASDGGFQSSVAKLNIAFAKARDAKSKCFARMPYCAPNEFISVSSRSAADINGDYLFTWIAAEPDVEVVLFVLYPEISVPGPTAWL